MSINGILRMKVIQNIPITSNTAFDHVGYVSMICNEHLYSLAGEKVLRTSIPTSKKKENSTKSPQFYKMRTTLLSLALIQSDQGQHWLKPCSRGGVASYRLLNKQFQRGSYIGQNTFGKLNILLTLK